MFKLKKTASLSDPASWPNTSMVHMRTGSITITLNGLAHNMWSTNVHI